MKSIEIISKHEILGAEKIKCYVYNKKLVDKETIAEHIDITRLVKDAISIEAYHRAAKDCPFNRGNWIIDIKFSNYEPVCLKFLGTMTKERFEAFVEPLQELWLEKIFKEKK